MKELGLAIEGGILIGCAWTLLALVVAVLFVRLFKTWRVWRRKSACAVMSIVAVIAIWVGGTKPARISVNWDDGLHDNGTAVDTNDLRRIDFRWTFDNWIPNVATVSILYITISEPESEPVLIGSTAIAAQEMAVMMPSDATNYVYYVEQSFIPDAPVVTNGVYHIKCFGGDGVWIPQGLMIYGDENLILPPELPSGENYLRDLTLEDNNEND